MADAALSSLVTGATAVLSGLLGYGAARGQQLVERARLRAEEQRYAHEQQQLAEERQAETVHKQRVRREALYLEYLKALDQYVVLVTSNAIEPASYSAWWQRFQDMDNQMDLFAAAAVVDANRGLYAELDAVSKALRSANTFGPDVRRAFGDHRSGFEAARAGLVAAMRGDVQPRSEDLTPTPQPLGMT